MGQKARSRQENRISKQAKNRSNALSKIKKAKKEQNMKKDEFADIMSKALGIKPITVDGKVTTWKLLKTWK